MPRLPRASSSSAVRTNLSSAARAPSTDAVGSSPSCPRAGPRPSPPWARRSARHAAPRSPRRRRGRLSGFAGAAPASPAVPAERHHEVPRCAEGEVHELAVSYRPGRAFTDEVGWRAAASSWRGTRRRRRRRSHGRSTERRVPRSAPRPRPIRACRQLRTRGARRPSEAIPCFAGAVTPGEAPPEQVPDAGCRS